MASSSLTLVQPLHSLPSLLAISDLRSAVLTSRRVGTGRDDAESLLAVDPLAALRALRLASAPLWAPSRAPETLAELVAALGSPAAIRLLDVPTVGHEQDHVVVRRNQRVVVRHDYLVAARDRADRSASGQFDVLDTSPHDARGALVTMHDCVECVARAEAPIEIPRRFAGND